MIDTSANSLAALVEEFLAASPQHRAWMEQPDPLQRCVEIRSTVWRPWLEVGGHPARTRSYCGPLPDDVSAAASGLLDSLPVIDPPKGRRDRSITRAHLAALAKEAHKSREDGDLIRLWVATMVWGSGTSNGRGPWRTAQGLADADLVGVLCATFELLAESDVEGAYRNFDVDGCGESFFTKWLWAASLGVDRFNPRPLILDDRVRATLGLVYQASESWNQPRGAQGYIRYIDIMSTAASLLGDRFGAGLTAEKLEWLLFERRDVRRPDERDSEPCLIGLLAAA